jgi:hypothetical protein
LEEKSLQDFNEDSSHIEMSQSSVEASCLVNWFKNEGWKGYRFERNSKGLITGIAKETSIPEEKVAQVFFLLVSLGMEVLCTNIGLIQFIPKIHTNSITGPI